MLTPGSILQDRYRIVRLLAKGGMGAVYEAHDLRLSSTVALKETFFADEEMRKAFRREASLLATLRNRALPKVIDHFAEGEGQFLVMEFISGHDLAESLNRNRGPFPPDVVTGWGIQVLRALEYLHRHDPPIIHRDIKPQNLKLTEAGEVILLDFGLAKGSAGIISRVSRSVQGYTLRYAPLEQIRGLGTDPRSDLYSLAASLYHLMTNVPPPDALDRVSALVSNQRDPLVMGDQINPAVPPMIARILHATLEPDRERRPPSAAAMRGALERALAESSSANTSPLASEPTTIVGPTPDTDTVAGRSTTSYETAPTLRDKPAPMSTPGPSVEGRSPAGSIAATIGPRLSKKVLILGATGLAIGLIVFLIAGYLLVNGLRGADAMDGSAASNDKNRPTPLTASTVICGPGGEDRYFGFDAKRGTLVLILDALADGSGVTVELSDSKSQGVRFEDGSSRLSVNSSGHVEEAKGRVLIDHDQPLVMKVGASSPKEVKVYRVKLEGEIGLAGGLFSGSGKPPESLSALLAPRDNPTVLASREVLSAGTAKDLYYSLTAGPGELAVTLDVFGGGCQAAVEVFGEDSKEMRFDHGGNLSVNSSSHVEREIASVLLDKQQPVLMRITNTYPNDTRAIRVTLDGLVQGVSSTTARDAVTSALAKYFADRDNPARLTSNEITGAASDKDLYYAFGAGPGDVEVYVEAKGDGAAVAVEAFDDRGKKLNLKNNRDRLSIFSSKEELKGESTLLQLDREQELMVRISFTYPRNLEGYKVMFNGAVKLAGAKSE